MSEYRNIPLRTGNDLNSSADINQLMQNIEYLKKAYHIYPVGTGKYIQFAEEDGSWKIKGIKYNGFNI